ncbi:hypothetical protein ETD86_00690 [Nonomuraea turkmeniaca]|uniref:Uncharacterized protein n=1 Tax=Nonomuraea turkmeniaca TaxID=103838 RepID=A0A5S4FY81_9ACTN|nr:hypothetical protein ETD86_00690 [Nonomuraea turkmeniaca]
MPGPIQVRGDTVGLGCERETSCATFRSSWPPCSRRGRGPRGRIEVGPAGRRQGEQTTHIGGRHRPSSRAAGCGQRNPALVEALTGRFDDHHAELARLLLDQIDTLTGQSRIRPEGDRHEAECPGHRSTSSPVPRYLNEAHRPGFKFAWRSATFLGGTITGRGPFFGHPCPCRANHPVRDAVAHPVVQTIPSTPRRHPGTAHALDHGETICPAPTTPPCLRSRPTVPTPTRWSSSTGCSAFEKAWPPPGTSRPTPRTAASS